MAAKKLLMPFVALLLGAGVTTGIYSLLGISFKEVGELAGSIHMFAYMVWGGVLLGVTREYMSKRR
ncbi:MAG TPA: hypothetical protein VJL27_02380 [Patescibacteria group bacterium]|nr:hypothetical protein [Patescibacteria group bacterium]